MKTTNHFLDELEEDEQVGDESAEKHLEHEIIVDRGQEPLRIDKFIIIKIAGSTRNKVQQAIDNNMVLVNQQPVKANYKVKAGDNITIYSFDDPNEIDVLPENISLDIVYEDAHVMVINKPAGFVVHPGFGNKSGTVINAVMYHLLQANIEVSALPRIGLVHRIDKDTTGLLVIGKTEKAVQQLSIQFKDHSVSRKYQALVWGNLEQASGTIETYIGRHERLRKTFTTYKDEDKGKHAITHYTVLERFNYVTLVECQLETGRTHQIRVHMKHIGHTLFNDITYGGDRILKGTVYSKYKNFVDNCFSILPRQALHAKTLGFTHPETGEAMFFETELPNDMQQVIDKWRTYVKAKNLLSDM